MNKQHHVIGKTILELDTGHLADIHSLHEEVSSLLQQQAIPKIEDLFDRFVSHEEVVRLDRVVVEIEAVDSRSLEAEFVEKLLKALNQTLSDRLKVQIPINTDVEPIIQEPIQANWEVLLYFLEYGRLPWWCLAQDWTVWLNHWETVMQSEINWRSPLKQLLSENQSARERLVMQLPETFRHQLLLQLQPGWTDWQPLLAQARQLMQELNLSRYLVQKLERQAWLFLLATIRPNHTPLQPLPVTLWTHSWLKELVKMTQLAMLRGTQPPSAGTTTVQLSLETPLDNPFDAQHEPANSEETINQSLHQRLLVLIDAHSSPQRHLWLTALEQVLPATSADSHLKLTSPDTDLSSVQKDKNETAETVSETDFRRDRTQFLADESNPNLNPNLPLIEQENQELTSRRLGNSNLSLAEEKGGLYVTQAGLVLLHPFLRPYLDTIGLLEGESFRDQLAQQTGIYLLYYLGNKQTDAPEYELVLPKLLCGWPLNEPIVRNLDLPETALTEGEHLLQTVIDHWQALKSTSPDGLREGFLRRDGKLTRSSRDNWKLQIEKKTIDLLLSRLPWGLSLVKLPWMEDILTVEWT